MNAECPDAGGRNVIAGRNRKSVFARAAFAGDGRSVILARPGCDIGCQRQMTGWIMNSAMRLGYFTMPIHPRERDWAQTLREDRETVILADRPGFPDAFTGEHLTDACETITNSMIFLASLVATTTRIKLATGTSNLSQSDPVLIAAHAVILDHLAEGRFIFGISPGALTSDAEALGILGQDCNMMFAKAIDVILEIRPRDPPYGINLPDNRYYLTTPYQQPHPEMVGTVLAPFSRGSVAMGQHDFHPLSANLLMPEWLPSHWENDAKGKAMAGQIAWPQDWRVARTIFVADDEATARSCGGDNHNSPYAFNYRQILAKLTRSKRLFVMAEDKDQPDEAVTHEHVMNQLVLRGTVNNVVDQILALHEKIGDFGEVVYAGMDWVDPALARRSMELMANEVMPCVNAALGRQAAE
jgi:alkanesulfonate monooxygenase SsuD/methylene tetrahydromethanopterin reductase-like flavin-dependent oxidoreductase (luciferase family)